MELITCKNLSVGYYGTAIAKNISFTVDEGDYLCIVGENGSGNSTLMRTLLNLQPALEGELIFGNGFSRTDIGYLPQQSAIQRDFPASVREVVLSGCRSGRGLYPFHTKKEKDEAAYAMRRMNIEQISKKCYRELSGGQQQRVLLARALCAARKLLLLDEPVSGLDPVVTAQMYELIYELNKNDGITVIMISHDIDAALTYADNILETGAGGFFGSRQEYIYRREGINNA